MRVGKLHIKNFRSIEELDIELQSLSAFIGPNNAGKSNILDALDLILGETWPTIRAFSERDFRNHDPGQTIEIKTTFDSPINDDYANPRIYGFMLNVSSNNLDYFPVDGQGDRLYYSSGYPLRVSTNMREQIPLLHIGIDRRVEPHLRPTGWTLWGRIQKELNRKFGENGLRVGNFETKIGEAIAILHISELDEVEKILREKIREQTNLPDLSLEFGLTDPLEHYKTLRPYLKNIDVGPEFDPEEMGLGTQSALVIALAEVYSQIVRESAIMLIDEPELYLHPHACRRFYSTLKALSENGVQVIYTTHSPAFLDIADYQSIYLVHKEGEMTKVFEGSRAGITQTQRLRLTTRFDVTANEVFFARAVLLVEGPEDKIAAAKAFELSDINTDKEGISIVPCGGKPGMPFMARILTSLRISSCALCDRDPGKPTEKQSEEIKEFVGDENFFELPGRLEDALEIGKKLRQGEMIEFLSKYSSLDDMPETFKGIVSSVIARMQMLPGFNVH